MPSAAVSAKKLLNINTFKFLIVKIIITSVFSYINPILHLFSDIIIIFIPNYNQKYCMIKKLKWIIIFLFLSFCVLVCIYLYTHRKRLVSVDESRTVYIKAKDSVIHLYRNGKPFKIKGASGNASFELLSKIGGNTIRVYDTINLTKTLNKAHENQLAVIVDISLPKYNEKYPNYDFQNENNKLKLKVEKLVNKHKNHPALLFWNLGNELDYPLVFRKNNFIKTYNELIDIIHTSDPNHLVSTTLIPSQSQTLAIHYHSPNIDLIGFNVFGNTNRIQVVLDRVNVFTKHLPYFIGEYAYNGPWEQQNTSWGAPIEPTSSKKAEQYAERYNTLIKNDKQSIGDLVFFWGQKQERTHTWFSIFDKKERTSELFYKLNELWGGQISNIKYPPKINYMLIDKSGAQENLVYKPNMEKTAELNFEHEIDVAYQFVWEIYSEGWDYNQADNEKDPIKISKDTVVVNSSYTFKVPSKTGPYRIFVSVYDAFGNFSTTNTPFYVLN